MTALRNVVQELRTLEAKATPVAWVSYRAMSGLVDRIETKHHTEGTIADFDARNAANAALTVALRNAAPALFDAVDLLPVWLAWVGHVVLHAKWRTSSGCPMLTQSQVDALIALQDRTNAALRGPVTK